MRIELMPGMTNVIRFPVERRARPSLDLLRDIAADCREVFLAVDSFEMELDEPLFEIGGNADQETAEYILNNVRPEPGAERRAELDRILEPLVTAAVRVCREAHDAAVVSAEARIASGEGENRWRLLDAAFGGAGGAVFGRCCTVDAFRLRGQGEGGGGGARGPACQAWRGVEADRLPCRG